MIKVWKDETPEKATYVRLIECGDFLRIQVVDEAGNDVTNGFLALISLRGITRKNGVNEGLGFSLDDEGRIKLDERTGE